MARRCWAECLEGVSNLHCGAVRGATLGARRAGERVASRGGRRELRAHGRRPRRRLLHERSRPREEQSHGEQLPAHRHRCTDVLAVLRGGQAVTIAQINAASLISSGLWGLLYYHEIRGVPAAQWVAAATFTAAMTVMLGFEKGK